MVADLVPGRLCYLTNRRDGIRFDAVLRDLTTGEEQTGYASEGSIDEAVLSPDGSWLAVTVPSPVANSAQLLLVDLSQPEGQNRVTALTSAQESAMIGHLQWFPDGRALLVTTNAGREFTALARYDLASRSWSTLIEDDGRDVTGWLSPDGSMILAETNDDGGSRLAVHSAAGALLREIPLPAEGSIGDFALPDPTWSPDGASVVLSLAAAEMPGDALAVDVATGQVRTLTNSLAALPGYQPARPAAHRIPTPDGELVPIHVYRSDNPADPALAGSAVLVIHGGPESQARLNFNPIVAGAGRGRAHRAGAERARLDRLRQALVLRGRRRQAPRLGGGPRRDPRLPAASSSVDPARAALYGGSYGGYMVLAGLAFQPELWAAGRGHRRDLVAGHVPGEHLGLPPGAARAGVRPPGPRPRFPGLGVTADQDRRHPRTAVHHPRRE